MEKTKQFSIEYGDTQTISIPELVKEMNDLGVQAYGVQTALGVDILTNWLEICPDGFYFLRRENNLAGYLYAMPISQSEYQASLNPQYDERTLFKNEYGSERIRKPYTHYLFSSLVVAPQFQEITAASLILRFAFLKRVIQWRDINSDVFISAQALSRKGELCAESFLMKKVGKTLNNWIIYNAVLSGDDLKSLECSMQKRIIERSSPNVFTFEDAH